jgi:hypothetical protein
MSVRAMLIALRRFGIASVRDSQQREREWARYRASKSLDLYGLEQEKNAMARRLSNSNPEAGRQGNLMVNS